MTIRSLCLVPLLLVAACAEGGSEDRPASEVKLAANHYMLGVFSTRSFAFPVPTNAGATDNLSMSLTDDSKFRVRRGTSTVVEGSYALAKDGTISILLPGATPRSPSIRYLGAYGLEGQTGLYTLADRFTSATAPDIGFYFGNVVGTGTPDLVGDWHVFTQHLIFSTSLDQIPGNVGRSVVGTIVVAADGVITGSGTESTDTLLNLGGRVDGFNEGRADVKLRYISGLTGVERVFVSGVTGQTVFGIDEGRSSGRIGLLALQRKRTGGSNLALLAGEYLVNLHTLFVDPSRAGADAAVGKVTIGNSGGFRLEAVGAGGVDFTYTGSLTLADDGRIELTMDGVSVETPPSGTARWVWRGSIDQGYRTLVLAAADQRRLVVPNQPTQARRELNFLVGLRKVKSN